MAKINLLPWREELRRQQQQDFFIGIGIGVAITCALLFGVYLYIDDLKEYQQRRNQMLNSEIAIVSRKIKEIRDIENRKNKLLTKIELIQKLQESRPEIVHLFYELAKITPDGVFLTRFTQSGKLLTFTGKAQSNARVSAYMRAIEKSHWLHSPKLKVIKGKANNKGRLNYFSMTAIHEFRKTENKEGLK